MEPLRRRARLLSGRLVARDTWWMEFDCPEIAAGALPGQFVMLGKGLGDPLTWMLPRPFSVGLTRPGGQVGILIRAYGEGSRALCRVREGDSLVMLGPLGRGFSTDQPAECVAGGVGLAPFIFLADWYRRHDLPVRLIYGERDGGAVFDPGFIARLTGCEPEIFTEDGSHGRRGRVLEALSRDSAANSLLMGCGPSGMLRALAEHAVRVGRRLEVSVEEHMGCGVGTCQGCVVRGAGGDWIKSCIAGPVFDAADLDWDRAGGR
ncbi:MAG: hypothetical protein J4G03_08175 [Gemmatimonadetes bacterium]|nr:hypothetical protein [Gemmatimonadota bacterium]